MVDIVEIKSAVRAGEITVYEEAGSLYIESTAGGAYRTETERLHIQKRGGSVQ